MPRSLILAVLLACLPSVARAVTIEDIIALSRAGLSDEVLAAVIDADRTMFTLSAEQILELKAAGVSDAVLRKMIGSRREFAPPVETPVLDDPDRYLVITGTDPAPRPFASPAPFVVSYPVFVDPFLWWAPRLAPMADYHIDGKLGGFGRFINDGWIGPPFQGTSPPPRRRRR